MTPDWVHMLDEFALRPDPMTWYGGKGLRITPRDQYAAVQKLVQDGLVKPVGVVREQWRDDLYGITPAGRAFWEQHVKGKRRRPRTADPISKYSVAQLAAAMSPVDVFDLVRVPWTWSKGDEQLRLFGETEPPERKGAGPRRSRQPVDYMAGWVRQST